MKNMKIMAVLTVLLAAALFVGAASAADDITVDVAVNNSTGASTTFADGETIYVNFSTANVGTGDNIIEVIYNGEIFPTDEIANADTIYSVSFTAAYGVTEINFVKSATGSDTITFDPVSPATITVAAPAGYRGVSSTDDAFVYEHIIVAGATGKLTKYSEGSHPTALNQISGDSPEQFYLTEAAVNGQYGAYYYEGAPSSTGSYIYIWYPELSIQAELTDPVTTWGSTAGDSIDGKTINKDTNVTFLINTPKVGPAFADTVGDDIAAKIVFTTPVGGKTTVFGVFGNGTAAQYNKVAVPLTQNIAGSAVPGDNAAAGTWTAQAEFINYAPFANNAKKSNTISYTVQSTTLAITAAKDSVVRSNPFTVTIQGESIAPYFVYIEGSDTLQPVLQPGQSGMKSNYIRNDSLEPSSLTPTYNENVQYGGTYGDVVSWAFFETDASGKRTIQYNTYKETDDKTYTIRVLLTFSLDANVATISPE